MSIEDNFQHKQFNLDDDLDTDEVAGSVRPFNVEDSLDPEAELREQRERERAEQEGRDLIHSRIKAERLSRPQNIMIKLRELDNLKQFGEVEINGINFRGRDIKQGEKVILFGRDEKIEARFNGITKKNKDGTISIKVSLIK